MKKTIKGISLCFLMACLTVSCKKKEETVDMNNQSETTITAADTTITAPASADTATNAASSARAADTPKTNDKSTTGSSETSANSAGGKKSANGKGKNLSGYSAPDGIDAENNDGDQYTKNDKKHMPSGGTSIK